MVSISLYINYIILVGFILTDPVSRNVSLNSMVNFTCQAQFSSGADNLNFLIDSQTVTAALMNRGFTELPLVFNVSVSPGVAKSGSRSGSRSGSLMLKAGVGSGSGCG